MVPVTFRVVLDANVLFPFSLRDTLLRAAAAGYYQAYWSDEILDETTRNLNARGSPAMGRDLDPGPPAACLLGRRSGPRTAGGSPAIGRGLQ